MKPSFATQQIFLDVLKKACDDSVGKHKDRGNPVLDRDKLTRGVFREWFTTRGRSYFFLFRKNRRVTNISYMELMSLIKLHAIPQPMSTQFESSKLFKNWFRSIWDSLGTVDVDGINYEEAERKFKIELHGKCDAFTQTYWNILENLILFDSYYGSALIHVPPTLHIDLNSICGEAGYIHSCGLALYFRNSAKARKNKLIDKLSIFLDEPPHKKYVWNLIPYCHEWFDEYDKDDYDALRHGLNDLKVHLDKFHIGDSLLVDVLRELQGDSQERLSIADGTINFRSERSRFKRADNANKDFTIWIGVERSIRSTDNIFPGDDYYIVCYVQYITNSNPLIVFNEKKPGWTAPVTLPHTLCAAMLNIARPGFPQTQGNRLVIVDPFLGSGTVLLEAQKLGGPITFVGGDNKRMSSVITRDNARFFSLPAERLREIQEDLKPFVSPKHVWGRSKKGGYSEMPPNTNSINKLVTWSLDVIHEERSDDAGHQRTLKDQRSLHDREFSKKFWNIFKIDDNYFVTRLIFYTCWRAIVTNMVKLASATTDESRAVNTALEGFVKLLTQLINIRHTRTDSDKSTRPDNTLWIQSGLFSKEAILPGCLFGRTFQSLCDDHNISAYDFKILTTSADELLSNYTDEIDLIITDPPYGFNTNPGDAKDFAKFYSEIIGSMAKAIKPFGQIVLCLPESSSTGQSIPAFVTKKIVVRQLILAAEKYRKHVIQPSLIRPAPRDCFTPPYYWRSERTLTRTILHFCFGGNA